MPSAVIAARRDPEGARVALLAYGGINGWPDCRLEMLQFDGGRDAWEATVRSAVPLYLGLAWDAIERLEEPTTNGAGVPAEKRGPESPTKETTVPVLEWKEMAGVEPGIYPAIVREILEEEGQFGPQLRLQFVVLDDDGHDTAGQIRGWCSAKWGAKTKLLEWAKALLRTKCPKDNEPIDTDNLIGKRCDIEVQEVQTANGPRGKIVKLYPYKTMSTKDESD